MKKILPLILFIMFMLCSCAKDDSKKAYCFSMVFERISERPSVTAYCKTAKDSASGEMENIVLNFYGKDFKAALGKAGSGDYDIYFNSICAYYLSDTLVEDDVRDISILLLDNAKYKTDNHTFSDKSDTSSERLHKYALEVCKNESIKKTQMELYTPTLKKFRQSVQYGDLGNDYEKIL